VSSAAGFKLMHREKKARETAGRTFRLSVRAEGKRKERKHGEKKRGGKTISTTPCVDKRGEGGRKSLIKGRENDSAVVGSFAKASKEREGREASPFIKKRESDRRQGGGRGS